jgi:hypothetical protein
MGPRTYSKLRSRKQRGATTNSSFIGINTRRRSSRGQGQLDEDDDDDDDDEGEEDKVFMPVRRRPREELSYSQYYWLVVARVAETLLQWIGDENDDDSNHDNRSSSSREKATKEKEHRQRRRTN